jgi:hypothetical protein
LVTFFAPAKKVTRSSAGGVEALALRTETSKIKMDSGVRRNDEPESYRLLRRRSGSSGSKNRTSKIKMDSRVRGNDDLGSYPLLRRRSGSSGFVDQTKEELDSRMHGSRRRERSSAGGLRAGKSKPNANTRAKRGTRHYRDKCAIASVAASRFASSNGVISTCAIVAASRQRTFTSNPSGFERGT